MEQFIGRTIGQYQIISELGRGGMAVVYKAYQPALQRYVAIKVLSPHLGADPDFVQRFQHEAIAAAKLRHPNIVTIHDVGLADGINYIVMEFIEGESLAAVIRRSGAIEPARTVRIIGQVAEALDYAHQQGFIHRDIKPSNIMLGANDHATLTDFGIAKAMGGTRMTQTGMLIGTPEYMSPEQVRGLPIDHRADIYSLGIVAYEMLSGQVPFSGDTASVLYKQAHELPPPIRTRVINVPPHIANAIDCALAKEPALRFATAGAFAQALAGAAPAPIPTPSPPPPKAPARATLPILRRPAPSIQAWWIIGGVALVILCATVIGALTLAGALGGIRPFGLPAQAQVTLSATAATEQVLPGQITHTSTPTLPTITTKPPQLVTARPALGPSDTPSPTASTTPTPSSTRTFTPSPTKTSTPTPTKTFTPTPTRTFTPTPSPTGDCPPVTGPFAGIWPSIKSKLGCATSSAHENTWMAIEEFQKGLMFWRQDNDRIYALYSGNGWGTYANAWRDGDPEYTCGTPASPPTPKRGFGKTWCSVSSVRSNLGNATTAERGYYGTVQDFQRGLIIRTDTGKNYVMYSGDGWETR